MSNFIEQALRGELLTLYGDGSQSRSFRNEDGLVEGPINLGNPDEFRIRQLAELVRARIKHVLELTKQPLPGGDPTIAWFKEVLNA